MSSELAHTPNMLEILLTFMQRPDRVEFDFFELTLNITEAMVFNFVNTQDMSACPRLCEIFRAAPLKDFCQLTRLLNLFIFDPDEGTDDLDCMARARSGLGPYVTEARLRSRAALLANHDLVLSTPQLLVSFYG